MFKNTPRQIALYAALASVGVSLLFVFVISLFLHFDAFAWLKAIAALVLLFTFSYLISYYLIERFINQRIALIYKAIHREKTNKNKDIQKFDMGEDIIGEVNREVIKWAQENREQIKELKDLEKFRKEFIGNLAHELKTPLFNLQGYLLTLLEGGLEDENINREYLEKADKNLERLLALVRDLDEISRLESGETILKLEKFNLIELVQDVFSSVELQANQKKISLQIDPKADKTIWVLADRSKIFQVLTNLTVNSINYGKKGGETTAKFFDLDENILIEFADNGIGIEKNHLARIFERFYRVDKSRARNQGGTGLGLAIVKHIIDAHNQSITVSSEIEKGTTFSFTLKKAK
jgi:two-component system phosphate regulon sensor histidine kinase PhoR